MVRYFSEGLGDKPFYFISGYLEASFLATIGAHTVSPVPNLIVFNETLHNPGEHYDITTGKYTVPFDGLYHITVNVKSANTSDFGFYLMINGTQFAHTHEADTGGPGTLSTIISTTLPLQCGQQVWVTPWNLDSVYGRFSFLHSWFAGYLVNAD